MDSPQRLTAESQGLRPRSLAPHRARFRWRSSDGQELRQTIDDP
jgi:hypothetical protein